MAGNPKQAVRALSALLILTWPLSVPWTQRSSAVQMVAPLTNANVDAAGDTAHATKVNAPGAAGAAQQQYESYDYAEPVKQFSLVIPKGLKTVRGILAVCNYMGGDSRGYYTQNWYTEL